MGAKERVIEAIMRTAVSNAQGAMMLYGLTLMEEPTVTTIEVTPKTLTFNPTWIGTLSDDELTKVVAHCVSHLYYIGRSAHNG